MKLLTFLHRLGGFPNVKKDGTAHAGKVIQPVLKLLNDDQSEAVLVSFLFMLRIGNLFLLLELGKLRDILLSLYLMNVRLHSIK